MFQADSSKFFLPSIVTYMSCRDSSLQWDLRSRSSLQSQTFVEYIPPGNQDLLGPFQAWQVTEPKFPSSGFIPYPITVSSSPLPICPKEELYSSSIFTGEKWYLLSFRRGYWIWTQRRQQFATWTQALVLWKGIFV